MRHDYDHPPDWDSRSDVEKSRWMVQERCRRLAQKIGSPAEVARQKNQQRLDRKAAAHSSTVTLEEYR